MEAATYAVPHCNYAKTPEGFVISFRRMREDFKGFTTVGRRQNQAEDVIRALNAHLEIPA